MRHLQFASMLAAGLIALGGAARAGGFDVESVPAGANLAAYQSVYVAQVRVELEESRRYDPSGSSERPVRDSDAAEKAEDLREELIDGLDGFSIVSGPGAGVLTVEPILTELRSSRPTLGDYERQPGLSAQSVYAGGAAMRIVFSEAGTPKGEISDQYATTFSDGRPRVGIWDDADRAFSSWARRLPEFIRAH